MSVYHGVTKSDSVVNHIELLAGKAGNNIAGAVNYR